MMNPSPSRSPLGGAQSVAFSPPLHLSYLEMCQWWDFTSIQPPDAVLVYIVHVIFFPLTHQFCICFVGGWLSSFLFLLLTGRKKPVCWVPLILLTTSCIPFFTNKFLLDASLFFPLPLEMETSCIDLAFFCFVPPISLSYLTGCVLSVFSPRVFRW